MKLYLTPNKYLTYQVEANASNTGKIYVWNDTMRGHGVDFIRVNLGKKQAWKNSRSKHGYWANNSALKIVNFTAFLSKIFIVIPLCI